MNTSIEINQEILLAISSELANHYRVIPKSTDGHFLELYVDETNNLVEIKEELELLTGKQITLIQDLVSMMYQT